MNSCETCLGEEFDPCSSSTEWHKCDKCGDWDWCKSVSEEEPNVEAELRRKLKKANRENEDLRQLVKFQRDALGNLGEQFLKLSTLLKEQNR